MNHKRKHRRGYSSDHIDKPNKWGWEDRRTMQERKHDEAWMEFVIPRNKNGTKKDTR